MSTNRDDIIRMAREAEHHACSLHRIHLGWGETNSEWIVARDTKLVELAAAAEREACAKVADRYVGADPIADAIRARGEKT